MSNNDKETGWEKVWPALVATIIGGVIVYILTTGQLPKINDVIRRLLNPASVETTVPGPPEGGITDGDTDADRDTDTNRTGARTDPTGDENDGDAVTWLYLPNVEGMEQYEAMRLLKESGISYEILGNREEAGADGDEVKYIRSQSVPGPCLVTSGTVISLQLLTGKNITDDNNEENEFDRKLKEEGWVLQDWVETTGSPTNTPTDRYVFVRPEWNENSYSPKKIWRHYVYPKG